MKKLTTCIALAAICSPALGIVTNPDLLACLCDDALTPSVPQGSYCPDGTYCPYKCPGCTNINWTSSSTGYESRLRPTCDIYSGNCNKTTEYRCAAGYYGNTLNGNSGCSACPRGGTSPAGSKSITSCYLPNGTSGTDSTGSYVYTSDCYYN